MSLVKKMLTLLVVYSLSIVFTTCVFFLSLLKIMWYGKKFFVVKNRESPPACLTDPELGQHSYVKLKDVKIHYVEAGDRSKPLLLFVHGFPDFWYSWRYQIREFKKDYWVIAIDLRGYGDSSKPPYVKDYAISKLSGDIKGVVEGLGRTSCILAAHDWGGAVAWRVSIDYPELVEKLVIMNCPHPVAFRQHLRGSFKQLFMSWYIFCFQLPYLPEVYLRSNDLEIFDKIFRSTKLGQEAFPENDVEAYKYTFGKPGAFTPPVNYYRNTLSLTGEVAGKTSEKVKVPVLIIWGAEDIALDTKMAHLSADFVESCTVKVVPAASHWVQNDRPTIVNDYIRDFLTGKEY